MQEEWIGRSEGARVNFTIKETGEQLPVFTTRPDTLWGVTFMSLAPEHPLIEKLVGIVFSLVEPGVPLYNILFIIPLEKKTIFLVPET